jgi:predicted ATPase
MREGITDARTAGSELGLPMAFWSLAEVHRRAGRTEEALEAIDQGLTVAERTEDRLHEPELQRSKGELLLARDPDSTAEAEGCFRRALELARGQEARSWELRAAVSLGRLLRARGGSEEARRTLGEVYDSFTEGLETSDLRQARDLLEEWS